MGLLLALVAEPEEVSTPLRGRLTASRNAKWWRLEMERRRLAEEAAKAVPPVPAVAPVDTPPPAAKPEPPPRLRPVTVPPAPELDWSALAAVAARVEALQTLITHNEIEARQIAALDDLMGQLLAREIEERAMLARLVVIEAEIARLLEERARDDAFVLLLLAA